MRNNRIKKTKEIFTSAMVIIFGLNILTINAQVLTPNLKTKDQGFPINYFHKKTEYNIADLTNTEASQVLVIVQLKGDCYADAYKQKLSKTSIQHKLQSIKTDQQKKFSELTQDLQTIYKEGSGKGYNYAYKPELKQNYSKLYFGQAIIIDSLMAQRIEKLPYVKKVHFSRKVQRFLVESVTQINADKVWNEYNNEGDSIRVGIIDTGIDYNHSALGGGFGEGYKVTGGYDFANDDNDPMDDNGHGTHVAGIVAAENDVIRGVAPKALLYAIKVLDEYGFGWETNIISGIEYCIDPNNDGDFSDKLDVINLSLGGFEIADDPMIEAIENAIALGVTSCIAAGNSGWGSDRYISSPGSAPSAITVGAVEKNDSVALFNIAGPTKYEYNLKPDIMAPGVHIKSSVLNNNYFEHSGTSMATPHIAGVCALLKKQHPNWGPKELKSAIMLTAKDLGKERSVQGSGIVDTYAATGANIMVDKPNIEFGIDSALNDQVWKAQSSFKITNLTNEKKLYEIAYNNPQPGIELIFNETNISLEPFSEKTIEVDITVYNKQLLPKKRTIDSRVKYTGAINITGENENYHVNWMFLKGLLLNVNLTGNLYDLYLESDLYEMYFNDFNPIPNEILLPTGKHLIIANFLDKKAANKTVIKEVLIDTLSTLRLDENDASHKIVFNTQDEDGNLSTSQMSKYRSIAIEYNDSLLIEIRRSNQINEDFSYIAEFGSIGYSNLQKIFNRIDYGMKPKYNTLLDTLYISPIPETMKVIIAETRINDKNIKHLCHNQFGPFKGINENLVLSNESIDYNEITLIEEYDNLLSNLFIPNIIYKSRHLEEFAYGYSSFNPPMGQIKLFMPSKDDIDPELYYGFTFQRGFDYESMPLVCIDNKFVFGTSLLASNMVYNPKDTIILRKGAFVQSIASANNIGRSRIMFHVNNLGPHSEKAIYSNGTWQLRNMDEKQINSGTLKFHAFQNWIEANPEPGIYTLEIKNKGIYSSSIDQNNDDYYIDNKPVNYTSTLTFDLTNKDANPPTIASFHVKNWNNKPSYLVDKNDSIEIAFTIADYDYNMKYEHKSKQVITDSTKILYKPSSSETWEYLTIDSVGYNQIEGMGFISKFKIDANEKENIDIKISAVDSAGNKMEQVIAPAFIAKNIQTPVAVDDEYTIDISEVNFLSEISIANNDNYSVLDNETIKFEILDSAQFTEKFTLFSDGNILYRVPEEPASEDYFTYRISNERYKSNIATVLLTLQDLTAINNKFVDDNNHKTLKVYPNPAHSEIKIDVDLNQLENIEVAIFNLCGQKISQIFEGKLAKGTHQFTYDLQTNSSLIKNGIYLVSIQGNSFIENAKLIIE